MIILRRNNIQLLIQALSHSLSFFLCLPLNDEEETMVHTALTHSHVDGGSVHGSLYKYSKRDVPVFYKLKIERQKRERDTAWY